jgi:hypothetical protein
MQMGSTPTMDTQFMYPMQPGMMNPQFMGYDPNNQHMGQGFPMGPVEMQ